MRRRFRRQGQALAALAGACIATACAAGAAGAFLQVGGPETNPYADVADRLTSKQINRVRFFELRASRQREPVADRVVVEIPADVTRRFLSLVEGKPDFRGEQARRRFLRQTPPAKLATIAYWTYDTPDEPNFADLVDIKTDPEIMVEFKRRILPQILTGCASTACHGNPHVAETKMRLYNDPKRSERTTYANFLTLREWVMEGRQLRPGAANDRSIDPDRPYPMLDTNKPGDSLLLNFMLPEHETRFRHPGESAIKPVFQNRHAPGYRRIEQWIGALRDLHPEHGYGFHVLPRPGFLSDEPADIPEPADTQP